MVDVNPYEPMGLGASEIRSVRKRGNYLPAFFVCCFLLTLLVPLIEYRQANTIHHLPLFFAYVGLFFPESCVFAILYVAGHMTFCLIVSFAAVQSMGLLKIGFKNVVTETTPSESEK